MIDCRIRGGTVVDGTGAPARACDVDLDGGTVVAVGAGTGRARRTIDAEGLVVAPGFVDVHTHYDAQIMWDPALGSSSLHGVTTVIGGNCGFTLAPLAPDDGYLMRMMARVEGIPVEALSAGLDWDWDDFGDWLDRIEGNCGVNAGFLVGHSALRRRVLGDGIGAPALPEQVDAMVGELRAALAAGALGFSSSRAPTHHDGEGKPVPSRGADVDELMSLAGALRGSPATAFGYNPTVGRFDEHDIDLMVGLAVASGRPLNWNVLSVDDAITDLPDHQLQSAELAAQHGAQVLALITPVGQRLRYSLLTGMVLDSIPGWGELFQLPPGQRLRALREPTVRERLRHGAHSDANKLRRYIPLDTAEISETFTPVNAGLEGRLVADIARERGTDPFDTLLDIAVADELRTGWTSAPHELDRATWERRAALWLDERTIVGASDAGAHLDMFCGASFTTAFLGQAVRERELLTVEQAVRELTDVPARRFGLRGRGRVFPGWCADLVVFDPTTIDAAEPRTRTDLPGGAARLFSEPRGVEHVIVNGTPIIDGGHTTGILPGDLLRAGRDTEAPCAT